MSPPPSTSGPSSSRRAFLGAGVAGVGLALAGCSTLESLGGDTDREYELHVDRVDQPLEEYVRYDPGEGELFGEPAREALAAILPEGRHTTYGYEALPGGAYVVHEGRYYQTQNVVTGRRAMDRQVVRLEPIDEESVPESALLVDDLPQWDGRVVKILHAHEQTGGRGSEAELVEDDGYVLRRPAELEGTFASGDLDGRVVTMTRSGTWAYRAHVSTERLRETAHTALAVEVADSRDAFREVALASRVDSELAPSALPDGARDVLERAIGREAYRETEPLSDGYVTLLDELGLAAVEEARNGLLLVYDGDLYRYALYVNET